MTNRKPISTNSYGFGTKSIFHSKCETVELIYDKGVLIKIHVKDDKVCYDGIRHLIELYSSDLDSQFFIKVPTPIFISPWSNIDWFKSLIFILTVILLGVISNCAFLAIVYKSIFLGAFLSVVFAALVFIIFYRNGSR